MRQLTESCLEIIKKRPDHSHKGTLGKTLLIGGNAQYGGAIMMSAEACVNAGAGLTTIACDSTNKTALHARMPEVMIIDWNDEKAVTSVCSQADVLMIGPGLSKNKHSENLMR